MKIKTSVSKSIKTCKGCNGLGFYPDIQDGRKIFVPCPICAKITKK